MPTRIATCPFCGLLCDDLVVEPDGEALRVLAGACDRSRAAFARLGTPAAASAAARVDGTPVSTDAALDAAASVLRRSRRPLIAGLGTDVDGMRSALALARRTGAVVDHAGSPVKYRNLHVLQEAGWITTTLAEVKNRADLLMLIGDGWRTRFPRFVERVLAPSTDMFGAAGRRHVILVDEASAAAAAALPPHFERLELDAPMAELPVLFGMLSALAAGQPADPARLPGIAAGRLDQCIERLRAARYGVAVWAAADLELPHAELALQALARLIRVLNNEGRFAALPLAGTNGDLTANAVHTWQSGVPYPASHANRQIDFDPTRYAMRQVLAHDEPDCILWISSLSEDSIPPPFEGPTIVLGRADMHLEREPDVFVPVATPGVDADGHLLRSDKVISLYLRRLRASRLPSVAQAVDALLQRFGPRHAD